MKRKNINDSLYDDGICERCGEITDGQELNTYGGFCRNCIDVIENESEEIQEPIKQQQEDDEEEWELCDICQCPVSYEELDAYGGVCRACSEKLDIEDIEESKEKKFGHRCLVCEKEVFGQSNNITYGNYIMHFDCWDDLIPGIEYNIRDTKEIRLQKKNDRLKSQNDAVARLIKRYEENK